MNTKIVRAFLCAGILLSAIANESEATLLSIDFEGNPGLGWTGTDSFLGEAATNGAAPNGATYFDFVASNVITESGVWIDDPTRARGGDRMFWLRPYNDPDTICVGGQVNNAIEGTLATYTFDFAAFDLTQPGGNAVTLSKPAIEIMTWDDVAGAWDVQTADVTFDDGQVTNEGLGLQAEYSVSDWDNLQWQTGTTEFVVPNLHGRPMYLWTSMTNDSNGMLIDNISIEVTLSSVPEPSAGILVSLTIIAATFRRRKRRPAISG